MKPPGPGDLKKEFLHYKYNLLLCQRAIQIISFILGKPWQSAFFKELADVL